MELAKIITRGDFQYLLLPESCRLETDEVYINRIGDAVILTPPESLWDNMLTGLKMFTDDFLDEDIEDLPLT